MRAEEPETPPIKLSELVLAFEFVSASAFIEHNAYICRKTGRIIWVSEDVDLEEDADFPDDPDPVDYLPVPHKRERDLGKRLALSFVAEHLPGSFDKAREIFSRKGAYSRFKQLLHATGTLDKWYRFEEQATEAALAEWCNDVGVPLLQPDLERRAEILNHPPFSVCPELVEGLPFLLDAALDGTK
jgi:hypothetical protein